MKTVLRISLLAVSLIASVTVAGAADNQVIVYSGPVGVALPASMLSPSLGRPKAAADGKDAAAARTVRIVLRSPYGN